MLKLLWFFCIPWNPAPVVSDVPAQWGESVDRWYPIVEIALDSYGIPEEIDSFMRVMHCESRGDPNALHPESKASGLMQHLQYYWVDRAEAIGMPGYSPFDPVANIFASAWLLTTRGGGWQHWTCYGV